MTDLSCFEFFRKIGVNDAAVMPLLTWGLHDVLQATAKLLSELIQSKGFPPLRRT
jgi:hypothetical protein